MSAATPAIGREIKDRIADRLEYEDRSAKMIAAFLRHDEEEMQKHWQAVEDVKNKYGGLPPEAKKETHP